VPQRDYPTVASPYDLGARIPDRKPIDPPKPKPRDDSPYTLSRETSLRIASGKR
jgi:hypothetical protein